MSHLDSFAGIPIDYSTDYTGELVERVRNWLKESPMSERISRRRCEELLGILDEYSEDSAG